MHVGPHKTGTTALQGALAYARADLESNGVVYPGRRRQHSREALYICGHRGLRGSKPAKRGEWERLVAKVDRAPRDGIVVLSSEYFGDSDEDTARVVTEALGGPRVHVLVTLRPLAKIMPSQWQQYIRNGRSMTYESWLDGMLRKPPYDKPTPSFWRRHHHEVLVERWVSIVGADRVTVLVIDEQDRTMLLHSVEQLLGLPRDLLQPEPGRSNRSFTSGEIELVRQINLEFQRQSWSDRRFRTHIFPMMQRLQDVYVPGPDEHGISTPDWALDRVAEIGSAAAKAIAATGAAVIGDLSSLGLRPASRGAAITDEPQDLPVDLVKEAVLGVLTRATRTHG